MRTKIDLATVSEFITGREQQPIGAVQPLDPDKGIPTFRCIRQVTSSDVADVETVPGD